MAHSKRIIISGYYGFANTGDEAVLSALVSGLREQGGDSVDITVLSASPEETSAVHGVRALSRTSVREVSAAVRGCDLLISGGGSLIQDVTSFRSAAYYLSIISLARRYRRKVMILGQGIGPLRRSISRRLTGRVLNGTDLITVRDPQSAVLLRELGVCRPPVRVTADPTFMLEPCRYEEALRLLADVGIGDADAVIAVSMREWPEAPEIESASVAALSGLSEKLSAKILLTAMYWPGDHLQAVRIKAAVSEVIVQPEPWTPEQLLGVLGKCSLVVGMRLHSLIFATAVGTPALGIVYDPKVEQFLTSAGQRGISLKECASGCLAERTVEAWRERDILSARLSESIPPMRNAARENMQLALDLLRT